MSNDSQEYEVALLIAADNAPEVGTCIARATHLANYTLTPRDDERLHDIMLDTAEHALQHALTGLFTDVAVVP